MMHQVLNMQLPNEEGDMHIIQNLVDHGMPYHVFFAFYTIEFPFSFTCQ